MIDLDRRRDQKSKSAYLENVFTVEDATAGAYSLKIIIKLICFVLKLHIPNVSDSPLLGQSQVLATLCEGHRKY